MKTNVLFRPLLTTLLVALLLALAGCPRTDSAAQSSNPALTDPEQQVTTTTLRKPPPAPGSTPHTCAQFEHHGYVDHGYVDHGPVDTGDPRQSLPEIAVSAEQAVPSPPRPSRRAPAYEVTADATVAYAAPAMPPPLMHKQTAHWQAPTENINRENYTHYDDNPVRLAAANPVSTFSIDVDTGAYTNVRRMLEQGRLPPADAVRAEEFINYFDYAYTAPVERETPFSVTTEIAPAPWNTERQLLLIGIQGYCVPTTEIPPANLVFLIDTSGSMNSPDKLPLVKASLKQLVSQLDAKDRVAIVTYAGSSHTVLSSTPGNEHARINASIDGLSPGGSTYGEGGIKAAYAQAAQGFIAGGINRVILATDGDFNVGQVSIEALKNMVAEKRKSGIALTTLGFGQGNYNDAMAVALADIGNGSHHYIDRLSEGRRVLVEEMSSTLLTIAKDVKIQIEFNPAKVREYRLIGYVKRMLRREDFNNDQIDAGEIGAGANVTALYEITPAESDDPRVDPLRYSNENPVNDHGKELAWLRLRYKQPTQTQSRLIERAITPMQAGAHASDRLRLAAAVAAFAENLRGGQYLDGMTYTAIAELARNTEASDSHGQRAGLIQLINLAAGLTTPKPAPLAVR